MNSRHITIDFLMVDRLKNRNQIPSGYKLKDLIKGALHINTNNQEPNSVKDV